MKDFLDKYGTHSPTLLVKELLAQAENRGDLNPDFTDAIITMMEELQAALEGEAWSLRFQNKGE